jgi:hypothetical protein
MVTVRRELTADDFRAFAGFVGKSAGGPSLNWAALVLVGLAAAAYGAFWAVGWEWDWATSAATFAVLFAWVMVVAKTNARAQAPAPDGLVLEPSDLTATDEGLHDHGARHNSLTRWAAVRKVAVTDDHVFIMFDRMLGLIVPRDCFEDDFAEADFLRAVRRRCPESAELTGFERVEP